MYKKQWQKVLGLAFWGQWNVDSMQEWNVKKDVWNIKKVDLAENVVCNGK